MEIGSFRLRESYQFQRLDGALLARAPETPQDFERYAQDCERASYCDTIWKDAQMLATQALKQDQTTTDKDPRSGLVHVELDQATVCAGQGQVLIRKQDEELLRTTTADGETKLMRKVIRNGTERIEETREDTQAGSVQYLIYTPLTRAELQQQDRPVGWG